MTHPTPIADGQIRDGRNLRRLKLLLLQLAILQLTACSGSAQSEALSDGNEIAAQFSHLVRQSRPSTIALTNDDRRAVVINRQRDTASIIRVSTKNGSTEEEVLGEVQVGREPRFVALSPDDKRAFVTNAVDGTLSVIDLAAPTPRTVGQAVDVGIEPRGVAVTPNGTYAFVANHSSGDVTIVHLSNMRVVGRVHVGGNPYSVAVTNDGDRNDNDERVFVTPFFAALIDPSRPDGFDDPRQGMVAAFDVGAALQGKPQIARLRLF